VLSLDVGVRLGCERFTLIFAVDRDEAPKMRVTMKVVSLLSVLLAALFTTVVAVSWSSEDIEVLKPPKFTDTDFQCKTKTSET
jgi:hypothetical protein